MCPICGGTGWIVYVDYDGEFYHIYEEPCICIEYWEW